MKSTFFTLLLLLSGNSFTQSAEALFFSVDASVNGGYVPWKSFNAFRNEYNNTNGPSLKSKLGSLSYQYGFDVGGDFFVSNHLISALDFSKTYGSASAEFTNGAKRIIRSDVNALTISIGWLQQANKSYWTVSTGFNFAFGVLRSSLIFPDGTRYAHTGGLSGVYSDVCVGLPLKAEFARPLSERLLFKVTLQGNYYFLYLEDGMQNVFITGGDSSLSINGKPVRLDISGVSLSTGLTYKIFSE